MAALHTALKSLGPTPFTSVPTSQSEATTYLQRAFSDAQTIIDSVPLPPPTDPIVTGRPRSSTGTSTASNVSEISSSSARSELLNPAHESLQKEWGKPIKLSAKDNPLGMAVYKAAGKDGKGAWFARRSVHEGLGFTKWKLGLQREFPETLEVKGGPGEGNIRGIGGERRVERVSVEGAGTMEVYHLSAQFPGPTTPRDFVTLLLTSSTALSKPDDCRPSSPVSDDGDPTKARFSDTPRHFMVISRPCDHPDCPPRDGFIRGNYESVEFIREIPVRPTKSFSTTDLLNKGIHREGSPSLEKGDLLQKEDEVAKISSETLPNGEKLSPAAAEDIIQETRKRGKTISFAGSRGPSAKGEAMDDHSHADNKAEKNPVEWIMITRSDPGGSVPRFMVERGTPGSIVADASKFLDWACKKEHADDEGEALAKGDADPVRQTSPDELEAYQTNGHLAGVDGQADEDRSPAAAVVRHGSLDLATPADFQQPQHQPQPGGLFSTVASVAYSGIENYVPQAIIDRLPGHQQSPSMSGSMSSVNDITDLPNRPKSISMADSMASVDEVVRSSTNHSVRSPSICTESSVGSFASAEDHFDDGLSTRSATSQTKPSNSKDMSQHDKELAKLVERKRQLDEKLAKAREKETKDKEDLTSKEEERVRRMEEKHAKEVSKQEERYKKEILKLEAKKQKEAAKLEAQKKKDMDKDEKSRLTRERDEVKQELEVVSKERDILREQVGALQRENTSLVVRLGKMEDGKDVLKEIKADLESNRSRSSSLRMGRGRGTPEKVKEATIIGGEKKELIEALK